MPRSRMRAHILYRFLLKKSGNIVFYSTLLYNYNSNRNQKKICGLESCSHSPGGQPPALPSAGGDDQELDRRKKTAAAGADSCLAGTAETILSKFGHGGKRNFPAGGGEIPFPPSQNRHVRLGKSTVSPNKNRSGQGGVLQDSSLREFLVQSAVQPGAAAAKTQRLHAVHDQ